MINPIDISKLSEAELFKLGQRIAARLKEVQMARACDALSKVASAAGIILSPPDERQSDLSQVCRVTDFRSFRRKGH